MKHLSSQRKRKQISDSRSSGERIGNSLNLYSVVLFYWYLRIFFRVTLKGQAVAVWVLQEATAVTCKTGSLIFYIAEYSWNGEPKTVIVR